MDLYKYCDFNLRSQKVLLTKEVWYSSPTSLNDPYDCKPEFEFDVSDSDLNEFLTYTGFEQGAELSFDDKKSIIECSIRDHGADKIGVYCLTTDPTNELMWAHYASNHFGMAIGWHLDKPVPESDDHYHMLAQEVKYTGRGTVKFSDMLECNRSFFNQGGNNRFDVYQIIKQPLHRIVDASYLSKSVSWKYENEVRFVSMFKSGYIPFHARIDSITYGCRFDDSLKPQVRMTLDSSVKEYQITIGSRGLRRVPL